MSASYAWKPASPVDPYGRIQIGLADAIAARASGYDDASRDELDGIEMDKGWVDWLEGVKAATRADSDMHTDAVSLIEAIDQYGTIRFEVLR